MKEPSLAPATSSRAVPATGTSATVPGKGMTSVMAKAETTTSTAPTTPAMRPAAFPRPQPFAMRSASIAPTPNSQTREKGP
ncbi:unannotated protein [freshwater metagenome]|uniref:Unannotated protein n=1 Tax=freshwater metagenome TaxID=449393 RepID=A0A6J7KT84_9ZZZZ